MVYVSFWCMSMNNHCQSENKQPMHMRPLSHGTEIIVVVILVPHWVWGFNQITFYFVMKQMCLPLVFFSKTLQQGCIIILFAQCEKFHLSLTSMSLCLGVRMRKETPPCFPHMFLLWCQHLVVLSVILVVFSLWLDSAAWANSFICWQPKEH